MGNYDKYSRIKTITGFTRKQSYKIEDLLKDNKIEFKKYYKNLCHNFLIILYRAKDFIELEKKIEKIRNY